MIERTKKNFSRLPEVVKKAEEMNKVWGFDKESPTREISKKIDKWIEETTPTNINEEQAIAASLTSTVPFLALSIFSGGGALAMASLEAIGNSSESYEENRNKGLSIEESTDKASKQHMANLIMGIS